MTRAQISCHGRRAARRSANQLRKLEDAYAHGRYSGHPEDTLESIAGTRRYVALARQQASTGEPIDFTESVATDERVLAHLNERAAAGRFRGTEKDHREEIACVEATLKLRRQGLV